MKRLMSFFLAIFLLLMTRIPAMADSSDNTASFAGVYGVSGLLDYENIYIVLTPDGHGRGVNSTSSINFSYAVEDGRLVSRSKGLELASPQAGVIEMTIDAAMLRFERLDDPQTEQPVTGLWTLTKMASGTAVYDAKTLKLAGVSIDAYFYPDGSVSWHVISDSESTVAQRWGVDATGLYMDNGDLIVRMDINGNEMTMLLMNGVKIAMYTFTKVDD